MTSGPRQVSVITAVLPEKADHLQESADSISAQQLPDGWAIEWCLQLDGPGVVPVPDVARAVQLSLARSVSRDGPAIARNRALGRSTGSLIKTLDADDQLTPGQLAREIKVFGTHPAVQWITSKALDLLEDGTTATFDRDLAEGPLVPRMVRAGWVAPEYCPPVHPATLCMRREAVCALGGWMALPAAEDTGLLLALEAHWPGYFLAEPGLLYRKWPQQLTAQETYVDDEPRRERIAMIQARLEALDRLS